MNSGSSGSGIKPWMQALIATGVLVVGIVVGVVGDLKTSPNARPDPYTGSDHKAYAELIDSRIAHISEQIRELTATVKQHVAQDMHDGARLQLATLTLALQHIGERFDRVDAAIEDLKEK